MRSRPASVRAFSTTAEPSGARIASMPVRGSKKENSEAIRAFFIRHMKLAFCRQAGVGRVEPGIALRQGEGAVPGDAAALLDLGRVQRLRGQTLHRVAVQVFDAHARAPP